MQCSEFVARCAVAQLAVMAPMSILLLLVYGLGGFPFLAVLSSWGLFSCLIGYSAQNRHDRRTGYDLALMRMARDANGRLTVEEVAVENGWDLQATRDRLERLVNGGYAEPWVNDRGLIVYVFPAFMGGQKSTARSPMEMPDFVAEREAAISASGTVASG